MNIKGTASFFVWQEHDLLNQSPIDRHLKHFFSITNNASMNILNIHHSAYAGIDSQNTLQNEIMC